MPKVFAHDAKRGALLLEAIRPGTALDESGDVPSASATAALVRALHETAPRNATVPSVADRIAGLFRAGEANYIPRPDVQEVVPHAVYERGRRAALALAAEYPVGTVVLHGDLTAAEVFDGGSGRGLVAIDPAPCSGGPAFDTVDLLMWQITGLDELMARAADLGARLELSTERILRWSAAFAPMAALELAEATPRESVRAGQVRMLLELAEHNEPPHP